MSLKSICVAKSKKMRTILERGSTHIEFQNETLQAEYKLRNKFFAINKSTLTKELVEYSLVDTIVIPSKFVEKTFIEKGFSQNRLFINHFGASSFFEKRESKNDERFRVLYLGSFSIRKGAYYLYNAVKELQNLDLDFWFIGKIDSEVKELFNELKKLGNVRFFGHINHYELKSLIEQCSIALHPSLEEGQSMVINQVMKVGIPFVATPNSGAEELVVHLNNGIIIEPSSTIELVNAVKQLYLNRADLRRLTENLENMDVLGNSWEAYGNRYLEFLGI
jgi:glycosyltransferase involved in cell wall biosynthesis